MAYELSDQEAADLKRLMLKVNLALMEGQQSAEQIEFAAMTMLNYAHAVRRNMRRGLSSVPPVPPVPTDDATAPINHETLNAA
jgi:hypothetical protein